MDRVSDPAPPAITLEGHRMALRFEGIASLMPGTEQLDRALPRMKLMLEHSNGQVYTGEQFGQLIHMTVQDSLRMGEISSRSVVLLYRTWVRFLANFFSEQRQFRDSAMSYLHKQYSESSG